MIGSILAVIVQMAVLLFLSPFLIGFGRTLKARLQTRRGPSVW